MVKGWWRIGETIDVGAIGIEVRARVEVLPEETVPLRFPLHLFCFCVHRSDACLPEYGMD